MVGRCLSSAARPMHRCATYANVTFCSAGAFPSFLPPTKLPYCSAAAHAAFNPMPGSSFCFCLSAYTTTRCRFRCCCLAELVEQPGRLLPRRVCLCVHGCWGSLPRVSVITRGHIIFSAIAAHGHIWMVRRLVDPGLQAMCADVRLCAMLVRWVCATARCMHQCMHDAPRSHAASYSPVPPLLQA
jgi:hypothetical protein